MPDAPDDPLIPKTIRLPESLWAEMAQFRRDERIGSEIETVRRLLVSGLRAEAKKAGRSG